MGTETRRVAKRNRWGRRPVPFLLRVAAEWVPLTGGVASKDVLLYRRVAPLTGATQFTNSFADVHIRDIDLVEST